jgi:hypothetical protein
MLSNFKRLIIINKLLTEVMCQMYITCEYMYDQTFLSDVENYEGLVRNSTIQLYVIYRQIEARLGIEVSDLPLH